MCVYIYIHIRKHECQVTFPRLLCAWDSPGKNTGVGCHFLLQGVFPTQGLNPCLLRLLHWQADSLLSTTWEAHINYTEIYTHIYMSICMFVQLNCFAIYLNLHNIVNQLYFTKTKQTASWKNLREYSSEESFK